MTPPNHALQRHGGITLPFQSLRLVAAVTELGSLAAAEGHRVLQTICTKFVSE